jgi:hypothetical protein
VLVLVLGAAYFVAAYGNEAFERVSPGELAAAQWVYDRPGNAQILFVTDSLAALITFFPVLIVSPIVIVLAWLGIALLIRAFRLKRRVRLRRRKLALRRKLTKIKEREASPGE